MMPHKARNPLSCLARPVAMRGCASGAECIATIYLQTLEV
jgi:hypothetical protein